MVEERGGWFVVNVRDARWVGAPGFGKRCVFERDGVRFPQTGIRIAVLEPGEPNCRYHRENAQEDFLVLSGACTLIANGEERPLRAWDFVHCPPGTSHVFVNTGDAPCALLMIGHRPEAHEIFYPKNEAARAHGAEVAEPTPDPRVAYADCDRPSDTSPPDWP